MRQENILKSKSYGFALEVVRLVQFLTGEKKEFVMSKQLLRSGTAVGALIREAEFAQSRPDFIHKMTISLKEANETEYWVSLLKDSGYQEPLKFQSVNSQIKELIALLVATVKTAKSKL